VLKRLDPIHDELVVHTFGGGDIHVAFDTRSELVRDSTRTQVAGIPAGSIVSVDTVMDNGKLFARTVRLTAPSAGDMSGQVVRYDPSKGQLVLRDPVSPQNITLRVSASTSVVNHDKPVSLDSLTPGALVHVNFASAQSTATRIEILAARGSTFTFSGKVVSVDLRARTVAITNTSDQSIRELATNALDPTSLRLLREGSNVSIEAEFDGERYNARTVTAVANDPRE
jgi:hypothetical protein